MAMKSYGNLVLLALFLVCANGQWIKDCDRHNTDCSCKDITYSICHDPPPAQQLHVGSLEECIQNCDLFGSFGQCNYLLYWETGPDENCKLIADTTIDQYLGACGVIGQPLRDAYGLCVSSAAAGSCPQFGCMNEANSEPECHVCDNNDMCGGYTKTQCEKLGNPGETYPGNIPDFKTCLTACISQQQSNPFTYVTYDQEKQECICYPDGLSECQITVVPYGLSLAQVEICDGCLSDADCPVERPICSMQTGRCVECEKDTQCNITAGEICDESSYICVPGDCGGCSVDTVCDTVSGQCYECLTDDDCTTDNDKPNCDETDHVCKAECTKDDDCKDPSDYCACHNGGESGNCPDGGACKEGCRGLGTECTMANGGIGKCNGNHDCIAAGSLILTRLTVATKACAGCSSLKEASGATVAMKTVPPQGPLNCTTGILDHIGKTDYADGIESDFTDPTHLSQCFQMSLSSRVTDFEVSWKGAGTWTPEKFELERNFGYDWPFCCYNAGGLSVSEGQNQTFTCEEPGAPC